MTIRLRCTRRA